MGKTMRARGVALVLTIIVTVSLLSAFAVRTPAAWGKAQTASEQLEELFTTIDLMDATVSELQAEMTAGNVTSQQLVQMYLDRIRAYDEKLKLNSIISINPGALQDAAALDQERKAGKIRGPLHGIPIIVKANYDVSGMATSAGANALAHMVVPEDAFVVKKLKDAGAVILANANMSEFAISAANSRSTLGGIVHNAYDGSKTPAGSSGGTAVAVTCNFAAAGLGTDTGGSIRNPSSFSNLYGIRPSKGLTSIQGVFPLAASRDTTGPMTRTAEDMALMLQTMAGTDPADDFTVEANADALVGSGYLNSLSKDSLKGKRIGYLKGSFKYLVSTYDDDGEEMIDEIHPDAKVEAMVMKAIANLRKAGAELVDLGDLISDELLQNIYNYATVENTTEYDVNKYLHEKGDIAPYQTFKSIILSGEGVNHSLMGVPVSEMADSFEETENLYTETVGTFKRISSWQTALGYRQTVTNRLKENNIDAVMYLSYFNAVPEERDVAANWENSGSFYDYLFGPALGLPEISLPMGFSDADGSYASEMPLGLSLFSTFGNEKTLMEIAYAYEQQAGDYIRKMPERTPALPDRNLNEFLENLMEAVYSIDYSRYNQKPDGKVKLMLNAYLKAENVNTKDPYATYEAAKNLARAYDRVMEALQKSGYAKVNNKITKVTSSKTIKYSKLKKKAQSFRIQAKVKGKAKLTFKKTAVTKAAKRYLSVSKTGKVKIKKGLKKGTYWLKVKITASETAAYKKTSAVKKIKITVR